MRTVEIMACATQRKFLEAILSPTSEYTEIGFGGSKGGGKTWASGAAALMSCMMYSDTKILLIRKGEVQVINNFRDEIRSIARQLGVEKSANYLSRPPVFRFPNRSELHLGHASVEKDWEKYTGVEYSRIGFEEATQLTMEVWDQIGTSRRPKNALCVPRRWCTMNPGGVGHCIRAGDVLTPYGWTPIQEMEVGDTVMTVDRHGGMIVSVVSQTHKEQYDGELVQIKTRGLTVECTPNHKIARKMGDGFVLEPLADFPGQATVLRSVKWKGQPLERFELSLQDWGRTLRNKQPTVMSGPDYAEFMGWFISEGHTVDSHKAFGISQMKPGQRQKIKALLARCGFWFNENKSGFLVYSPDWWFYLRQFGKCRDKYIPAKIRLSGKETLWKFFEAAVDGDGHWHNEGCGGAYYTTSERLAGEMEEVALKLGFTVYTSGRQRKDRVGLSYAVNFKVTVSGGTEILTGNHLYAVGTKTKRKSDITTFPYKGPVYCIGIEGTHSFVVRQNGSVWISGNSWVKERFVDPKTRWPRHLWIPSTVKDSLATLEKNPNYIRDVLDPLPEWQRKQLRDGDWDVISGAYFTLNPDIIKRTAVYNPFTKITEETDEVFIPPWASYYAGVDYGDVRPFAVMYMARWKDYVKDERAKGGFREVDHAHVFSEIYQSNLDLDEQAYRVQEHEAMLRSQGVLQGEVLYYADPSVSARMETVSASLGRTKAATWRQYGFFVRPARTNNREAGWKLMKMLMRQKLLTIDPECKALLNEMQGAQVEGAPGPPKSDDIQQGHSIRDDALDSLRYVLVSTFGIGYKADESDEFGNRKYSVVGPDRDVIYLDPMGMR